MFNDFHEVIHLGKARELLELVPDKLDTACWNAMIVGYAKKEWENEFGNAVFREDEECCFLEFSYYIVGVNLVALQVGKQLHEFILKKWLYKRLVCYQC